jgi:hypothetical protein
MGEGWQDHPKLKHVENVKISVWQVPLDKSLLTPDNGTEAVYRELVLDILFRAIPDLCPVFLGQGERAR